ncbi:MAG: Ada metal-binding domain-containing protein [Burkholderiales bacterium]
MLVRKRLVGADGTRYIAGMSTLPDLDPETCFRAFETRDARFDGRFFVAVRTTRIFCRPVCPARTPKRANVEFHGSAASAFASGFRPCLRCRPERAPRPAGETAGAALVARALAEIDAGALDDASLEALSARIGVTSRHLRRLFGSYLGAAPNAVAQTRRLMFARQLIDETDLPMTRIAFAAGFASVRRFNAAIAQAYRCTPSQLRQHPATRRAGGGGTITLRIAPMDASSMAALLRFYAARVFRGVEAVDATGYARSVRMGECVGWFAVRAADDMLMLDSSLPDASQLPRLVARVRRMFDLASARGAISAHLGADEGLAAALVGGAPRVPCAWDAFELAVRAVLGQQISVVAATTLAGRLVDRFGSAVESGDARLARLFPSAADLAGANIADLTALGIVRARAATIITLAQHVNAHPAWRDTYPGLDGFCVEFTALPGIGPWTAQYVAMRGFADPDAFPAGDLGLLRSARALGIADTARELERRAERWRPWRAYAAQALWNHSAKDAA